MEKKEGYWAVYDLQTNQYLHSGFNVKTLKKAIDEVWSFWSGGSDLEDKDLKKMEKWSWQEKKKWLEGLDFDLTELIKK
jgi:hypothetical protein